MVVGLRTVPGLLDAPPPHDVLDRGDAHDGPGDGLEGPEGPLLGAGGRVEACVLLVVHGVVSGLLLGGVAVEVVRHTLAAGLLVPREDLLGQVDF